MRTLLGRGSGESIRSFPGQRFVVVQPYEAFVATGASISAAGKDSPQDAEDAEGWRRIPVSPWAAILTPRHQP